MKFMIGSAGGRTLLVAALAAFSLSLSAQEALFEYVGPPDSVNLPGHAIAGQNVRINRRALQSPSLSIELFGETYTAVRQHIDRSRGGQLIWTGHLSGQEGDSVIITLQGNAVSGLIQKGLEMYRIGASSAQGSRLYMLDLSLLPPEDFGGVPDGGGSLEALSPDAETAAESTVQDLLVVYVQQACDAADPANPGNDCSQLEADIATAVADINATYAASDIDITMNLVGTHKTVYPNAAADTTLYALQGTSDGDMDEVHGVRDSLGADLVAMVFAGSGCGIGFLGSSASSAFSVTHESCLVGNRTLNHELGHNQGAHHDRQTVGGGTTGAYNYGYRRCNDGSVDDFGSPYFRTVMSYSCTSAGRVGRMSNPNVNYSGVP
ncbi:MAG: zinc-dependent metalloprotease family protein, partial [Xanthomonadales bacterium]|nr:zinc-dependent metalloprotease family protein [Xanthomonadales bacterium]